MSTPEDPEVPIAPIATAGFGDPSAADPADLGSSTSLDKVRDILFGVQMRELERRFARLEERLANETGDVKEEVMRRLAAAEQRTTSLNEQVATNQREFRQHQVEIKQRLIDDIRQQVDTGLRTLATELQQVRTEKADRAALAAVFTEIARRLNTEITTGAAEEPRGG